MLNCLYLFQALKLLSVVFKGDTLLVNATQMACYL